MKLDFFSMILNLGHELIRANCAHKQHIVGMAA